jgi:hypothetical protein
VKHVVFIFRGEVTKHQPNKVRWEVEGLYRLEEGRLRERGQSETRDMGEKMRISREPSSRLHGGWLGRK